MVDSLFLQPHYADNPYGILSDIRAETPVYKTHLPDGAEVYFVTRYADVQAALKDGRLFKNISNVRHETAPVDPMYHANMLKADPPEHTRLRALAHEAFTPKLVNQMRSHIQEIADKLLDAVQGQGEMDLIAAYAFPLPITVICEMLGVPTADEDRFRAWSSALIASGALSSETRVMIPELQELTQYLFRLVQQKTQNPQEDLISKLIFVEQNGDKLNPIELIATLVVLLVAGHETTVNLIGNGTLALLQHPDQFEKLKNDPALIKPAVEELLRYVNPVQFVNRYASVDLEIGGVSIPKGSHLLLSVASADHDPAYEADPETLNLASGSTQHVAFGQGIHYCLGAPLARLEGEIALATLLRRCPNLRLHTEMLEWRPSLEIRGLKSLPVTF
ncbi:MAG TPA: cytochrome P450 [Phototrophicaceae bacterium]|nr:cytochrome P450 [Phototrophicaceae bacterium]